MIGREWQMRLFTRRFELPGYRVSWREGAITKTATVGAYCHDELWPWWTPHDPAHHASIEDLSYER